jgi:hypothetical protein
MTAVYIHVCHAHIRQEKVTSPIDPEEIDSDLCVYLRMCDSESVLHVINACIRWVSIML